MKGTCTLHSDDTRHEPEPWEPPGSADAVRPRGPPQDHNPVLEVRDAPSGHYLPHGEPLAPSEWAMWLDAATPVADLQALLRPAPPQSMEVVVAGPKDFHLG